MEQPKNERVQRVSKTPKSVGFIVSLLLCASFFIGCIQSDPLIPQAPETYFVVEPTRLAAINYDGNLATGHQDSCISPNGKYILAAVLGGSKETMSAIV